MSRRIKILCGSPDHHCTGAPFVTDQQLRSRKAHATSEEAFRCYAHHLLLDGYTQIGSREFKPPGGGPVRLLTKKSRFGGNLRGGKESRYQPERGAGLIIG